MPDVKPVELVTSKQLEYIGYVNPSSDMVKELNEILVKYEITTPERIRHFLLQCCHESMGGAYLTERNWSKDNWQVDEYEVDFPYFNKKYSDNSMLGNLGGDDGYKYRGAGYIQLTGRYNYSQFAKYISEGDDIKYDEIMNGGAEYISKYYAWEATGFYWKNKEINDDVDKGGDVSDILKKVNMYDYNSLESRERYYKRACEVIK